MLEKGNQLYRPQIDKINEELMNIEEDFINEDKAREYLVRYMKANIGVTTYWLSGVDLFPFQEIAIKTMLKRDYVLGIWSRGLSKSFSTSIFTFLYAIFNPDSKIAIISKCLDENDYIPSDRGLLKLKDLVVGSKVSSAKGSNEVLDKWFNPVEDGYKITLKNGIEFTGKIGHKSLRMCINGEINKKLIEELKIGDKMPYRIGTDIWGNANLLKDFAYETTEKEKSNYELIENNELFYLLGVFLGNGRISKKQDQYDLKIIGSNPEILNRIKNYFNFVEETDNKKNNKHPKKFLKIFSKKFEDFLWHVGFKDDISEKCIPDKILQCSKENISSFLSGLMDTNGYCKTYKSFNGYNYAEIDLRTNSKELAKQLQLLFFNFGIDCSIIKQKFSKKNKKTNLKNSKKKLYKVRITRVENQIKFCEEIGFQLKRKKEKIENFLKTARFKRASKIPFIGKKLKNLKIVNINTKNNLQEDTARNIILNSNLSEKEKSELLHVCSFRYSHISKIEKVKTRTVDITVDNEKNYVGNGCIHLNTFRQSRELFKKIEDLAFSKKGALLAQCFSATIRHLNDEWSMKIGSSEVKALPLGDGCLQLFDSQILTKNSFTNFEAFFPKNLNKNIDHQEFTTPNTKVWSNGEYRDSDQQFYNGIRDTKKLKTKKGFSIESTLNHKFKTVINNKVVWKKAEDYLIGDPILIDKSVRWHNGDGDLTQDECYAFGAIIGDGFLEGKSGIGFATKDSEIVNYLKNGTPFNWTQCTDKACWSGRGSKKLEIEWLNKFDYSDPKMWSTQNKYIPQPILNSSKTKAAAFIRGLFDTDGNCIKNAKSGAVIAVAFRNASQKLVHQLQFLLLHFGIVANVSSRKKNHELYITGKDVLTFSKEIGFRLTRKKKILEDFVNNKKHWSFISDERVPIDKNILVDFCKANKVPKSQANPYPSQIRSSYIENKKCITKDLLIKFIEVYEYTKNPILDDLRLLTDSKIYFDTIASIEDGRAPTADIHVPDGHEYTANGFFSHNSKIRGFRFNCLIIDELLLMPEKVINEIIMPFLSTNKDPKKLADIIAVEDKLIKAGKMTEEERYVPVKNKMIGLSSASYSFEPLYKTYKQYIQAIRTGTKDGHIMKEDKSNAAGGTYAVLQLSYDYASIRCPGLYDKSLVEKAKNEMSEQQFKREFGAQFSDESGGFFNMKTMEGCTIPAGEYPTTEIVGDKDSRYILAIDPSFAENDSSDFFAMILLKMLPNSKVLVVHGYAVAGGKFKDHAEYFFYLYENFNIELIALDNAGGSTFMQFVNEDKRAKEKPFKIIEGVDFEDVQDYQKQLSLAKRIINKEDRRIIHYQKFGTDWIRRANEMLQANMDHKRIKFASGAEDIESEFQRQRNAKINISHLKFVQQARKEKFNLFDPDFEDNVDILDEGIDDKLINDAKIVDLIERQSFIIKLLKTQCAMIEISSSDTGIQKFVLPSNLKAQKGANRVRRDLYTVLLIGNWANKFYNDVIDFKEVEEDEDDFLPTLIK